MFRHTFEILVCVAIALPPSARAARVFDAVALLRAGQPARALALLSPAAGDPRALFYSAAALNRCGRFAEALATLTDVQRTPFRHPDLDFELGWSLLGVERWSDALARLSAYDQAHPGRGLTSEFLGRACLALRDDLAAEQHLREAIRRDPRLMPVASLYLAELARRRNNRDEQVRLLRLIVEQAPASPVGALLRGLDDPARALGEARERDETPWHSHGAFALGYDSNPYQLGRGVPLPPDAGRADAFPAWQFALDSAYDFPSRGDTAITVGGAFTADLYEASSSANWYDTYVHADLFHALYRNDRFTFRASEEHTEVGGLTFRDQVALRPAYVHRHPGGGETELAFTWAHSDFNVPFVDVQRRDADRSTVDLGHAFAVGHGGTHARAGAFYAWNDAKGADFDHHATGLYASVAAPLCARLDLDLFYRLSLDRYEHPNSLAGAGFAFARRDDVHTAGTQLAARLTDDARAYLRWQYQRDASNVDYYDFDRTVTSAGVETRF